MVDSSEPSSPSSSRRRVLSAVAATGAVAVAGCSTVWDQTGASDVVVHNVATEAATVSIAITDVDAQEPHTSTTLELAPNESVDPVNDSKLPLNTSYTVEVDVADGPSETFDWEDPEVELAPLHVLLDGSRNVRFLLQAG